MTVSRIYIGIDLSKDWLDIYDPRDGSCSRHENAAPALRQLAKGWRGAEIFVAFEATGNCGTHLVKCLEDNAIAHACLNPKRVREFANSMGKLAKTDAIDAQMISAYAAAYGPEADVPMSAARKALILLTCRRDQLVLLRAMEKNHKASTDSEEMKMEIKVNIDYLSAAIKNIEKRMDALIASDAVLKQKNALMRSVPGIGLVTAAQVLANLPEAGELDHKELAALVGLAPMNRDSGGKSGARKIKGGRKRLRDAFYMAAVSVVGRRKPMVAFYDRLLKAGKPKKVALIALARKLLTTMSAILKSKKIYAPT